jgi:Fe-S-cluster containining protein
MDIDFQPYFEKYEAIAAVADSLFDRVKKEHSDCVKCKTECSDCCNALFDLSLIEALYINHHFHQRFKGKEKEMLIEKANRADRSIYKIKKAAHQTLEDGKAEEEILANMAMERVRCPLLSNRKMCDLYNFRPITCRIYGIPTAIGGMSHTCGLAGFKEGTQYPTVHIDKIQQQLYELSAELVRDIKSKYVKMADMLVPLSMAILTEYDVAYLGIETDDPNKSEKQGEAKK